MMIYRHDDDDDDDDDGGLVVLVVMRDGTDGDVVKGRKGVSKSVKDGNTNESVN